MKVHIERRTGGSRNGWVAHASGCYAVEGCTGIWYVDRPLSPSYDARLFDAIRGYNKATLQELDNFIARKVQELATAP